MRSALRHVTVLVFLGLMLAFGGLLSAGLRLADAGTSSPGYLVPTASSTTQVEVLGVAGVAGYQDLRVRNLVLAPNATFGYLQAASAAGAAVSGANTGRLIYNSGTQTFQVSLNGAAYVDVATGTVTLQGAYNGGKTIAVSGGPVALSNATASGNTFTVTNTSTSASEGTILTNTGNNLAIVLHIQQYPSGGGVGGAGIQINMSDPTTSPALDFVMGDVGGNTGDIVRARTAALTTCFRVASGGATTIVPQSGSALTLTGGTVTASTPLISGTETWNAGGVAFKGVLVNITNTASAAGARLIDLQLASTTKFSVNVNGTLYSNGVFVPNSGSAFQFYETTGTTGGAVFTGGVVASADGFASTAITSGFTTGDTGGNGGYGFLDTTNVLDGRISRLGAASFAFGNATAGSFSGTLKFTTLTLAGLAGTYNNVATAGWGVPAIYGSGRSTAQTGAVASVAAYTVPVAADGSYEVGANVLVTTSTTHNFTVAVDYTDESNTARTLTLTFSQLTGTLLTAITAVTGAGPYNGLSQRIRCKANTSITIKTTGTFTTVTYNVEADIKQVK